MKTTKKASIAIYTPPMTGYRIEATYDAFQDSGSLFDTFTEALKKRNRPCSTIEGRWGVCIRIEQKNRIIIENSF